MNPPWILFVFLLSFAVGSCNSMQNGVENLQTTVPKNPESTITGTATPFSIAEPTATVPSSEANGTVTAITETTIRPTTVPETGTWAVYQNAQAAYSAQYPSDWSVTENVGQNGEYRTTFKAPNDEQSIIVTVLYSDAVREVTPDLPNTRCQQVTVSGRSGQRCLDTLNFSISTTIIADRRQYSIVALGKHPDETLYQRFLDSFMAAP
jgi:hypothetical protein